MIRMADVLLVDDDGSVLLTLAIALRRRGHVVTMAGDANRALEYLKREKFHVVVSDVRMPGMNGFDLAREIHALPNPPRVVLTSAYSSIAAPTDLAEAFLQKPLDIARLDELLQKETREPPKSSGNSGGSEYRRESRHDNQPSWSPAFATGH